MQSIKRRLDSFIGLSICLFTGAALWPFMWFDIYPLLNSSAKISDFQRTLYSLVYSSLDTPSKELRVWVSWVVEMAVCGLVYSHVSEYLGIYLALASITSMILGNSVKNFMEAK